MVTIFPQCAGGTKELGEKDSAVKKQGKDAFFDAGNRRSFISIPRRVQKSSMPEAPFHCM